MASGKISPLPSTRPSGHDRRVPWGDADPAGTLYFASVSRYCMEALEQWFVDVLGIDWFRINTEEQIGTPMARAEIDFKSAVTVGEVLSILVTVEKLGRSSIVFRVVGQVQQRTCWEARFVCVFVNALTGDSISVRDQFRSAIERYIAATSEPG